MMDKREWMLATMSQWVANGAHGGLSGQETVPHLAALYDAICAATPTVADEGWMEHDGDVNKAPPEDSGVEVQFRGGAVGRGHGGDYAWDHDGDDGDIVRWRYV